MANIIKHTLAQEEQEQQRKKGNNTKHPRESHTETRLTKHTTPAPKHYKQASLKSPSTKIQ
jgi:hypothetical protein